jgi:uncharacterized protein (TIGR02001 family)
MRVDALAVTQNIEVQRRGAAGVGAAQNQAAPADPRHGRKSDSRCGVRARRASSIAKSAALRRNFWRLVMVVSRGPGGISDRVRARTVTRLRVLLMAGLFSIAALGLDPPAASAQSAGANPQPNTTTPAPAAAATASTFDASVTGSLTSDYNYRGYTLSNHGPSVATTFEATYNIWFASINSASVRMPRLSQYQMTDYAGIQPVFGALTFEAGVEYFAYPGSPIDISYLEYYVAPAYAVTPNLTLGLNVYYAPDYSGSGAWENYNSVTAKYTFDSGLSFSGELGRQSFGVTKPNADSPAVKLPLYTYWNLGFSYVYKVLTFDLRYYASTLSRQSCYLITGTGSPETGSNGCDPAIIATLSWNGNLSNVK